MKCESLAMKLDSLVKICWVSPLPTPPQHRLPEVNE
jgi:hypothetical protein